MSGTYNLDAIIGKQLFAQNKVGVKRLPLDKEPVFRTFERGQNIGIAYSWLNEKLPERTEKYWMIEGPGGTYYYLPMKTGTIDESKLNLQGVKSEETIKQETDLENRSLFDKIQGVLVSLVVVIGGVILLKSAKK